MKYCSILSFIFIALSFMGYNFHLFKISFFKSVLFHYVNFPNDTYFMLHFINS